VATTTTLGGHGPAIAVWGGRAIADRRLPTAFGALDNLKEKLKAAFRKRNEKKVAKVDATAAAPAAAAAATTAAATDATKTDTAVAATPADAPAGESP
jgi:hypothetical protein